MLNDILEKGDREKKQGQKINHIKRLGSARIQIYPALYMTQKQIINWSSFKGV